MKRRPDHLSADAEAILEGLVTLLAPRIAERVAELVADGGPRRAELVDVAAYVNGAASRRAVNAACRAGAIAGATKRANGRRWLARPAAIDAWLTQGRTAAPVREDTDGDGDEEAELAALRSSLSVSRMHRAGKLNGIEVRCTVPQTSRRSA